MILRATILFLLVCVIEAVEPDTPFLQDWSEQFRAEGELAGATLKKVHVNKDGIVYVLTDRGMARLFGDRLALDQSFRPLIGKKILDSALARGEVYYLLEDRLICNGFAGTFAVKVPTNRFDRVAVAENGKALVSGPRNSALIEDGKLTEIGGFGKPVAQGGVRGRKEATGLGVFFGVREVCNMTDVMAKLGLTTGVKGKRVVVQGLGNVGYHAAKFFREGGANRPSGSSPVSIS
jgi:hypothetical protein